MNKSLKRRWVNALQATIDKYQTNLDYNTRPNNNVNDCPLCVTAGRTTVPYSCDACIHFSSFGQYVKCTNQRSRVNINPVSPFVGKSLLTLSNEERIAIKYRQSYLKKIMNKIINQYPII